MFVIPAIDIIDGKCVRLTQGDYAQKTVYSSNPVEVAKQFEGAGLKKLHLVDLDGAKSKHIVNHKVLAAITNQTNLQVDFGGGIKSDNDIHIAFSSGAYQVTLGSLAVQNRELVLQWLKKYGVEKIILGADVKNEVVAISGWQQSSNISLFDLLEEYVQHGIRYVICTDIARDGMLEGPAFELYGKILQRFNNLQLIASGGVSSLEDLERLKQTGVYGAITGKALYENKILLTDLTGLHVS